MAHGPYRYRHGWIPLNPGEMGNAPSHAVVTAQHVAAENAARKEYESLNHSLPSNDPRVKKALAKWQLAMLTTGGPVNTAELDFYGPDLLKDLSAEEAENLALDLAFRYRHGWIKLGSPEDKQFKMMTDPELYSHVTKGTPGAEAAAAHRGGLDYLEFPRGEWPKSPKDRNESLRSVKNAEARLSEQRLYEAAKAKKASKVDTAPGHVFREAAAERDFRAKHGGLLPKQYDELIARARADKADHAAVKSRMKANRKKIKATRARLDRVANLSNEGLPMDTDLALYVPGGVKHVVRPPRAPRRPKAVKVKKFVKAPGTERTPLTQQQLQARAAKPGHFRAKAIIARQTGNMQAAKKFEAKRMLAKAARAKTPAPAAPKPATSSASASFRPRAPRAPKPPTPKPFKPQRPRGPRRVMHLASASGAEVDLAANHYRYRHGWIPLDRAVSKYEKAKAKHGPSHPKTKAARAKMLVAKGYEESRVANEKAMAYLKKHPTHSHYLSAPEGDLVDLARLTQAERDALPASAFVFPDRRAYPIHDKRHAAFALAVSKGKPEAARVRAAVHARYGMG